MASASVFLALLLVSQALSWEALPQIPTGSRAQFLVLQKNGAYKYGYDTGDGNAAKQEADPANQVQGHYFYKNAAGQELDLKYTSGVQGFQPEGLDKVYDFIKSAGSNHVPSYQPASGRYQAGGDYQEDNSGGYQSDNSGAYKQDNSGDYQPDDSGAYHPDSSGDYQPDNSGTYKGDQEPQGDATYNFDIDTPTYKRTESSDASGGVQGKYSYTNKEGTHDLEYISGAGRGFVARSGSLSVPNGLLGKAAGRYQAPSPRSSYSSPSSSHSSPRANYAAPVASSDGSYSFSFNIEDQSREESGDPSGNVVGRYAYKNSAGSHDLSYKAGAETGFLVTGGNLAKPNGLGGNGVAANGFGSAPSYGRIASAPVGPAGSHSAASGDGSYHFGYSTDDHDRQEDSDAAGNVQGRYSYKNSAGSHDLSYKAGSETDFLVTGGSLSKPNGLPNGAPSHRASGVPSGRSYTPSHHDANSGDASYNFSFDTEDYKRTESSDAKGNVKGSFSYKSEKGGEQDLQFVAGSETGFQPTGGSLASEDDFGSGVYEIVDKGNPKQISAPTPSASPSGDTVISQRVGKAKIDTYLPPSNTKEKYGYIYVTNFR